MERGGAMKALASIPEVHLAEAHRAALTRDGLADAMTAFGVGVQTVAERVENVTGTAPEEALSSPYRGRHDEDHAPRSHRPAP